MFPGAEALGGRTRVLSSWKSHWSASLPGNIQILFFIGIGVIFLNEIFQNRCPSTVFPEQSGALAGCKLMLQMQNKHWEDMKMGASPLHLGKGD